MLTLPEEEPSTNQPPEGTAEPPDGALRGPQSSSTASFWEVRAKTTAGSVYQQQPNRLKKIYFKILIGL